MVELDNKASHTLPRRGTDFIPAIAICGALLLKGNVILNDAETRETTTRQICDRFRVAGNCIADGDQGWKVPVQS